jgi:hypothetical protein
MQLLNLGLVHYDIQLDNILVAALAYCPGTLADTQAERKARNKRRALLEVDREEVDEAGPHAGDRRRRGRLHARDGVRASRVEHALEAAGRGRPVDLDE